MLVQTMMQTIMLVHVIMQVMGDGGVRDITSHFRNESHKERPWACSNITCESFSFFPWHLISF
jgi:hypothetical protein